VCDTESAVREAAVDERHEVTRAVSHGAQRLGDGLRARDGFTHDAGFDAGAGQTLARILANREFMDDSASAAHALRVRLGYAAEQAIGTQRGDTLHLPQRGDGSGDGGAGVHLRAGDGVRGCVTDAPLGDGLGTARARSHELHGGGSGEVRGQLEAAREIGGLESAPGQGPVRATKDQVGFAEAGGQPGDDAIGVLLIHRQRASAYGGDQHDPIRPASLSADEAGVRARGELTQPGGASSRFVAVEPEHVGREAVGVRRTQSVQDLLRLGARRREAEVGRHARQSVVVRALLRRRARGRGPGGGEEQADRELGVHPASLGASTKNAEFLALAPGGSKPPQVR